MLKLIDKSKAKVELKHQIYALRDKRERINFEIKILEQELKAINKLSMTEKQLQNLRKGRKKSAASKVTPASRLH